MKAINTFTMNSAEDIDDILLSIAANSQQSNCIQLDSSPFPHLMPMSATPSPPRSSRRRQQQQHQQQQQQRQRNFATHDTSNTLHNNDQQLCNTPQHQSAGINTNVQQHKPLQQKKLSYVMRSSAIKGYADGHLY